MGRQKEKPTSCCLLLPEEAALAALKEMVAKIISGAEEVGYSTHLCHTDYTNSLRCQASQVLMYDHYSINELHTKLYASSVLEGKVPSLNSEASAFLSTSQDKVLAFAWAWKMQFVEWQWWLLVVSDHIVKSLHKLMEMIPQVTFNPAR